MENIFHENAQCIRIYMGVETVVDPFEKNTEVSLLNPIPIRGIVSDLVSSQIQWKIPGIVTDKAKELIIEKKHRTLLEKSLKIEVKENKIWIAFEGWRVNGHMQIREEGDTLRVYIYVKKS